LAASRFLLVFVPSKMRCFLLPCALSFIIYTPGSSWIEMENCSSLSLPNHFGASDTFNQLY
jgi:hypothetical protein